MSTVAAGLDYEAEETLLVSNPEQLRALGDELRTRILGLLRNRAHSTQQLSEALAIPKGTVGHHMKVLERAGLIRVVRTRKVRAVTEKFYGRVAKLFLYELEDPADLRAFGATTLRQAAHEIELAPEGATWGLVQAELSKKDVDRFERRLVRLLDDFRRTASADGDPFRLVFGMWRTHA